MTDPLAAHIGWLVWCLDQGYKTAEDRTHLSNWLLEDDATLSDEDRASKAVLLDGANEVIALFGAPLATLRAEVERLRNQAARAAEPDDDDALDGDAIVEKYAYDRVLDLIDKQREGQ